MIRFLKINESLGLRAYNSYQLLLNEQNVTDSVYIQRDDNDDVNDRFTNSYYIQGVTAVSVWLESISMSCHAPFSVNVSHDPSPSPSIILPAHLPLSYSQPISLYHTPSPSPSIILPAHLPLSYSQPISLYHTPSPSPSTILPAHLPLSLSYSQPISLYHTPSPSPSIILPAHLPLSYSQPISLYHTPSPSPSIILPAHLPLSYSQPISLYHTPSPSPSIILPAHLPLSYSLVIWTQVKMASSSCIWPTTSVFFDNLTLTKYEQSLIIYMMSFTAFYLLFIKESYFSTHILYCSYYLFNR